MVLGWPFMDSFFESIGALSALAIKWSAVMFEFMERSHGKAGNFGRIDVQPPKQKKYDLLHGCKGV